jgi:restriction system protein
MHRRSYRRTSGTSSWLLPFLLLIVLVAIASPPLPTRLDLLLPMVLSLGLLALVTAAAFVWQIERKRREKLKALQIADLERLSGADFEQYVGTLLKAQGFAVYLTKTTGDYGIDMLATKGRVTYAIQTKCYKETVSSHAVSEAVASKQYYRADKAVVITSNFFTPNAKMLAARTNCVLIDRLQLADWIIALRKPGKMLRIG